MTRKMLRELGEENEHSKKFNRVRKYKDESKSAEKLEIQ